MPDVKKFEPVPMMSSLLVLVTLVVRPLWQPRGWAKRRYY